MLLMKLKDVDISIPVKSVLSKFRKVRPSFSVSRVLFIMNSSPFPNRSILNIIYRWHTC
jgi:hypothetical protein